MTTDGRTRVLRLYHLALAREADDRTAFLSEACAGDDALRLDVESLLAHDPPDDFLESPAITIEATPPFAGSAGDLIGTHIGVYRVDSRLGSGGMGEVYRATDTALGREVAIKVLPPAFAFDPERRVRLQREARALAALNHPNIAHVYGLETARDSTGPAGGAVNALVMELVDGETLTQVLQKGPLAIVDALRYGAQIADALAAAHAHGIVHRDVKPANVMIGASGVKVLDFGLAKLGAANDGADRLPPGEAMTRPHDVVGTVAYMSPEQAEGKPVDARSDVFSLGVVLYEMLCGQRPFGGDTALASLAMTLVSMPRRPRSLRQETPGDVERIVLRCLEKRPEARYRSVGEVREALGAHVASRSAGGISRRAALVGASLVVLVGAVGLGARSYVQASRLRWVEQEAAPEVTRLIAGNRRLAAATLYRTAERYAPASRALLPLTEGVSTLAISFTSTPPGARIYISDYMAAAGDDLSQWQLLGETPLTIDRVPKNGHYRIRAVKEGFAPAERTLHGFPQWASVTVTLHPQGDVPPGMVWVPAMEPVVPPRLVTPRVRLPGFWMDRYEVTNRQFKAFVDAGGYQTEVYWREPFVKDGRTLSWREGVNAFRDATNRPGPAGWQLGSYPEGTGDLPVGGVSWYEAAAYAAFAGKSLPTLHEWWGAAQNNNFSSDIVTLSNFGGRAPEPAGANAGMAEFGAYDMAGNMKEWAANPGDDGRRYLLGGGWPEESSVFTVADSRPLFSRNDTFGFRCVRRTTSPPPEAFGSFVKAAPVVRSAPVDDATFQRFLDLHAYDKTDLEARVERVDDAPAYWRRETVSFRAGYGNERALAHLFLPKGSGPPYQVVAYLAGSGIHTLRRVEDVDEGAYQFLLRAGRAVVIPVLDGTLERGPSEFRLPVNPDRVRDLRWSMDMSRTLDYLQTRHDIDLHHLGYYGFSAGAIYGVRLTTVDRRFKTVVLLSAGLFAREKPPETDPLNFAPRLRIPVLILNGRDDFMLPYETIQRPLFEALGAKDKVFKRYDGGHLILLGRPDLIGEVLDWFDKNLGPVNQRP